MSHTLGLSGFDADDVPGVESANNLVRCENVNRVETDISLSLISSDVIQRR